MGTELRDIRLKIERIKAATPAIYPSGFRFPGRQFTEFQNLLSAHPEVYEKVERAYTAAHNVNEVLDLKRPKPAMESGGWSCFPMTVSTKPTARRARPSTRWASSTTSRSRE